jgi:UDP-glucose 4-epimerase
MVYGDFLRSPADEQHPTRPQTIYGTMKLAGEEVTRGLGRVYGIPFTIVRPSAVYGPTDMNRRVTQVFVEDALAGRELSVRGAEEKLDFTYVEDVAKGFVLAAIRPEGAGQTFNITSGHAHSLLELCEVLREHFPDLRWRVEARDESRPRRGTLDIARARRLLGYAPDWTLREGMTAYVEFMRRHQGLLAAPPT